MIDEVEKPKEFETSEISSILDNYYSNMQIEIAKFISKYYFSSLGKAVALFIPYKLNCRCDDITDDNDTILPILPILSIEQQRAYKRLLKKDRALLFGVTGSGKTEIFISLMAKTIAEGKQCIFLMPEISLTPQMGTRLEEHFG